MPVESAFDVQQLAAEIRLGFIPSERLPCVAQDAMEAGVDGPGVVRMAILQPTDLWGIGEATTGMLEELGANDLSLHDAVLLLAEKRAKRILSSGEGALSSISYFYRLYQRTWEEGVGSIPGLDGLANLDDEFYVLGEDEELFRSIAEQALKEFVDPALREQRAEERRHKMLQFEAERNRAMNDWPYVFDSPGRDQLLRIRLREAFSEWPRLLAILLIGYLALTWLWNWIPAAICLVLYVPLIVLLAYWSQYRRLKRERRDILLRMRYPEHLI